jgi:hypothetical protein
MSATSGFPPPHSSQVAESGLPSACGRPRVLIVSGVVPALGRGGGCIALHRHFVERQDFEVAVVGAEVDACTAPVIARIRESRLGHRLRRSRFKRFFNNLRYARGFLGLYREMDAEVSKWRPDLVFTVPDNFHTGIARRLARKLGVPLVVNFQDLFPLSQFVPPDKRPYPAVSRALMRGFHELDQAAALSLYTSEGMRDWFGQKANSQVLYPIGAEVEASALPAVPTGGSLRVVYAGNCYGAYGRMLLRLAEKAAVDTRLDLRIFAAGNDWPSATVARLAAAGIYRGFVAFEQLRSELLEADAFLTVMSFEPKEEPFVQTSFTTKWLDYAPCARPVFVWGPAWSSAAKFAGENHCGIVIDVDDAATVVDKMVSIAEDPTDYQRFAEASRRVAGGRLAADSIHQQLHEALRGVVVQQESLGIQS